MFWFLPIDVFTCFDEIYILTYMFGDSRLKHYLDIWMEDNYSYCFFDDGKIVNEKFDDTNFRRKAEKLISVSDNARINKIGYENNALSSTWFKRSTPPKRKEIRNNIYCYFRNHTDSQSKSRMWSVYKPYQDALAGDGYRRSFVPCNERATNKYRERSVMAYTVNIHEHPIIKGWFGDYGQCLSDDSYALSFLLQWVYRSQIRDGKPVQSYLPSSRMHVILQRWLAA